MKQSIFFQTFLTSSGLCSTLLFSSCWSVTVTQLMTILFRRCRPTQRWFKLHLILEKRQPFLVFYSVTLVLERPVLPHLSTSRKCKNSYPKKAWGADKRQNSFVRASTQTNKQTHKMTSPSILWTHFMTKQPLNQQPSPWVCCQRSWGMERMHLVRVWYM